MTEQNITSPEALYTGEQVLTELRAERWHNAESLSSHAMSQALRRMDRISRPDVTPLDKNVDFVPYMTSLSPAEVIALEGVGIDPAVLVPKPQQAEKRFSKLEPLDTTATYEEKGYFALGTAKLVVEQEAYETNTFSYRILSGNETDKASLRSYLRDRIGEAFAERPAYQRVHEAITKAGDNPDAVSIKLNIDEDAQGVLSVMADVGLFRWNNAQVQERILQGKITPQEAISQELTDRAKKSGIDSADFARATYNDGVKYTVFLDKHTGDISVTLEQQPADYYGERANQWYEVSKAFIDTGCARELFDLLAAQGLTVSKGVRHEMTRAGEAARFGSIYTQLTREVAKWIGHPNHKRTIVSNLLAMQNSSQEADQGDALNQEVAVREALLRIKPDTKSEPTRVLIEMMQGAVSRINYVSDLPVTKEVVHVSEKSCFDIMTYYLIGATNHSLYKHTENNVQMLENTHGVNNFITEQPIVFNGVRLPKGALFGKAKGDGGWFFQRLTPFTFDEPADIAVFGSEVAKAKDIQKDSIAQLGGFSLVRLVEYAT